MRLKSPVIPNAAEHADAAREWDDDDPTIDESGSFETEQPTEKYPWKHLSPDLRPLARITLARARN